MILVSSFGKRELGRVVGAFRPRPLGRSTVRHLELIGWNIPLNGKQ